MSWFGGVWGSSASDVWAVGAYLLERRAGVAPDTQLPTVPTSLSATASSSSQIDLTWTASTDDRGVAGYRVYSRVYSSPWYDLRYVSGTSTFQRDLGPSTQHCYAVSAVDAMNNESPLTAEKCATTASAGGTSRTLTVSKIGAGVGNVTGPSFDCGATCSASYASGRSVTLVAWPAFSSMFSSWSGCDSVSGATCTVAMSADRTVTATFGRQLPPAYTLTVSRSGTGAGTVTGLAVNCGATCSASYASGTPVTLTATPDAGSTVGSWTGCDSTSGATCTLTMNGNRSVGAAFEVDTTPRLVLGALPASSTTGSYTVTWTSANGIMSSTITLQEGPDASFSSNVVPYYFIQGETSKAFASKAVGTYCYRVAPTGYTNWSPPKCIAVTTPATQTVNLSPQSDNCLYSSDHYDSSIAKGAYPGCDVGVGTNWYWDAGGGCWANPAAASLVKFDVSALAGKTIDSARLRLTTYSPGVGYSPQDFKIGAVATAWSPATVSWNAAASFSYYSASWLTAPYPTAAGQVYDIDLKAIVQAWANGTYLNNGLAFVSANYSSCPGPSLTSFDAYEFYVPSLTVTYH
jgi:hypothetical protein